MLKKIIEKLKNRTAEKNDKGFTLVEILLAVTILSVAITPLVSIFVTTAKINSHSRKKLQAVITADSVQEATKGIPMANFWAQATGTDSMTAFNMMSGAEYGCVDVTYSLASDGVSIDLDTVKITSDIKKSDTVSYSEGEDIYSYLIKGITQGNKKYDAVIIYQKMAENSVEINGSPYMVDKTVYGDALYEYKIYSMIFNHTDNSYKTGASIKHEKDEEGNVVLDYITSIESSKRDSTKVY